MWVKALVLILRKNGEFLLKEAKVYKRYGAFVGFKPEKVKAEYQGDGVAVALVCGAPTKVDGDFGEFTLFLDWEHVLDLIKAFRESDHETAKLTGKSAWGGKRPYTSTWLHQHM